MRRLSDAEWRAFLLEGTRTAKLGVVRKDGSPLVTPVWFVLDDDGLIVFETGRESVKGRALCRDRGSRSASRPQYLRRRPECPPQ
jgi:hypothetical protein